MQTLLWQFEYRLQLYSSEVPRGNLPKVTVLYLQLAVYSCLFHFTCIRKIYYDDSDICRLLANSLPQRQTFLPRVFTADRPISTCGTRGFVCSHAFIFTKSYFITDSNWFSSQCLHCYKHHCLLIANKFLANLIHDAPGLVD